MSDFRRSVGYQIYPKSFCDSKGDGLGDLKGVTSKLDYIKELGVDYIWLTPFFVSPQNDNGYDVEDYYNIDPRYGTMEDFEELAAEAGKRGIRLMLDMVFNHTSSRHEWFKKAMEGDEKYKNYYIFRKGKAPGVGRQRLPAGASPKNAPNRNCEFFWPCLLGIRGALAAFPWESGKEEWNYGRSI